MYDSESILNIDHIPQRLLIIGGGPIGVELGQIFNTMGSNVCILETASRIPGSVDEELANRLQQRMQQDGIDMITDCKMRDILTTGHNWSKVELTGEAALLINTGAPIEAIAVTIHPHPTLTESYVTAVCNVLAQAACEVNKKTTEQAVAQTAT